MTQEKQLIKQAQSKNPILANDAMEILLEQNEGLIKSIANKFTKKYDIEFKELISLGQIGFVKAIKEFNLKSTNKLCTYAYLWIVQSIQRGLTELNMIYIPDKQLKLYWTIDAFKQSFYQSNGHYPSIDEIAKGLHISPKQVKKNTKVINGVYSLDKTINDENDSTAASLVADTQPNGRDIAIQQEAVEQLYDCLKHILNNRQLQVLVWTFGLDRDIGRLKAKEIAKRLDLSVPAVRKMQYSLITSLKRNKELHTIYESLQ